MLAISSVRDEAICSEKVYSVRTPVTLCVLESIEALVAWSQKQDKHRLLSAGKTNIGFLGANAIFRDIPQFQKHVLFVPVSETSDNRNNRQPAQTPKTCKHGEEGTFDRLVVSLGAHDVSTSDFQPAKDTSASTLDKHVVCRCRLFTFVTLARPGNNKARCLKSVFSVVAMRSSPFGRPTL